MIFNQTNAALVSIRDLKILRNLPDFWMKLSYLLFFFCLCGCLNPALLSDLTKHIWHTLIRLALADSESLSPSLSLSDRTDQCISFCALLWSALLAALFYLPGLCHAHVHSALLGCSALWELCCIRSAGWEGFVRILKLTSHSYP